MNLERRQLNSCPNSRPEERLAQCEAAQTGGSFSCGAMKHNSFFKFLTIFGFLSGIFQVTGKESGSILKFHLSLFQKLFTLYDININRKWLVCITKTALEFQDSKNNPFQDGCNAFFHENYYWFRKLSVANLMDKSYAT